MPGWSIPSRWASPIRPTSTRTSGRQMRRTPARRMEHAGALAALSRAVSRRGRHRAGGADLLPGAPVMAAYLASPHRLRLRHRARRAVLAVRAVLRGDQPRRHRAQGGRRDARVPRSTRSGRRTTATTSRCSSTAASRRRRAATPTRCCSSTTGACSPSISAAATPMTRAIAQRLRDGAGPSLSLTVPLFVLGLVAGHRAGPVRRLLPRDLHRSRRARACAC